MSAYAVEVSPGAFEDLQAIQAYIATELDSPMTAERTIRRILDAVGGLERFPLRNKVLATLPDGRELRRVKSGNYHAVYTVSKDVVAVLAVMYAKSDLEKRSLG